MKKDSRKLLSILLLFILVTVASSAAFAQVIAKNVDVPEGVSIFYYSRGSANIDVPSGWPGLAPKPPMLRITATHIEAGNMGTGDAVLLYAKTSSTTLPWLSVAFFTTDPDAVSVYKTILSGTPASGNTKLVSESVLKVERHGNDVTVSLLADQTILWGSVPPFKQITIPAFTMELYNVGGSIHTETSTTLTGYPKASSYTLNEDEMGFKADGAFTCPTWNYAQRPMTDCVITMHGIQTNIPPP